MKEVTVHVGEGFGTKRVVAPIYRLALETEGDSTTLSISGESADIYAMGVSPEAVKSLDARAATDMFYYLAAQNFPSTVRVEMRGVTPEEIVKYLMENFSEDELKSIFTR